jgi:hypothetical protein
MFVASVSGIKTHRDKVLVGFDRSSMVRRFIDIAVTNDLAVLRRRYGIRDTRYWSLSRG